MREILFRAKSEDNYPYPSRWKYGAPVEDSYESCYMMITSKGFVEIKKETVGEFTGLTDKNGVRIFEGDIIRYIRKSGVPIIGVVVYGDYSFPPEDMPFHRGFYIEWTREPTLRQELGFWAMRRAAEVIGNVYDNPELVGGGKE